MTPTPAPVAGTPVASPGGFVYNGDEPVAAYYVHWTLGRPDHGATFDFVLGRWGAGTTAADRSVVSLSYRVTDQGPQFTVTDAAGRPAADGQIASLALRRDQVIGTPLAPEVFALVDAVWLQDERIRELTDAAAGPQMIADLRASGFDPRRPHDVDHYLYFPSLQAADRAADAFRKEGYKAKVTRAADDHHRWLVLARHRIVPAETDVDELLRGLSQRATDHGGEYDGWEAAPAE